MRFTALALTAMLATAALTISLSLPGPCAAEEKPAASADRLDAVEREVKALKEENAGLKKRVEDAELSDDEFKQNLLGLSNLVDISGYADAEYIITNQQDENNRFRLHHLSLFFSKDVQKDWKFFSEVEFEDAPRVESNTASDTIKKSQGVIFVEQMYLQYHPRFDWDVRVGRFLTPAGYWSIYHYPPYVPTQRYPLFFKVMFPEVSDGLQLRKSVPLGEMTMDTHIYAANGSGNSGNGDRNNNKAAGARVNLDVISGLSTGLSYYREKDNLDSMNSTYGAHLVVSHKAFKVQTEYIRRHNRPKSTGAFNDESWYGQLSYDVGQWTLAGRYDWYDPDNTIAGNCLYRYTGALNYHVTHNVVGKAEYNRNLFEDRSKKEALRRFMWVDFNPRVLLQPCLARLL
ncbi:MAG: porin [Deltaproteobacteria bacterium]|nr:porin [Deltaproteobacteria bacterium]